MSPEEFLAEIDWLYEKYDKVEGEVANGYFSDCLIWLTCYYKSGDSFYKDLWRRDFDNE
jgi:hypothetical protein